MKNFIVSVSAQTSKVYLRETSIAVDGENIAGQIIFKFNGNEFIDGVARLEWQNGADKYFQLMEKVDKTYVLPIKNVMTKEGRMDFQLVVTQAQVGDEIPVFKSNQFFVYVEKAINAEGEAPDEYATWLDTANSKIAEIDNLNITATKSGNTETIILTDKQGVEHTTYIYDGEKGETGATGAKGEDAKINGVNTINIEAGDNITIDQVGNTLTINGEAGGSGSSKVNDVQVNGTSVVENKIANIDLTGKQDTLVSGTNIKTINNNAIIDSGDLDIPNIYFAKRTAIMGDSASFDATDLAEYNALCIKANKFLPIVVNENATTNDYFIYPYIRLNGKLRYTAFGLDLQGRLYKCYTAEKENPIIGQLTQNDLRILRSQSELLTTGNRFISYNPIYPYDPATKKYVDDNIGNINTILATLTTPGGN